ncbi:hypothetical protein VPH35_077954 [Triticum aestivum]
MNDSLFTRSRRLKMLRPTSPYQCPIACADMVVCKCGGPEHPGRSQPPPQAVQRHLRRRFIVAATWIPLVPTSGIRSSTLSLSYSSVAQLLHLVEVKLGFLCYCSCGGSVGRSFSPGYFSETFKYYCLKGAVMNSPMGSSNSRCWPLVLALSAS